MPAEDTLPTRQDLIDAFAAGFDARLKPFRDSGPEELLSTLAALAWMHGWRLADAWSQMFYEARRAL